MMLNYLLNLVIYEVYDFFYYGSVWNQYSS